MPSRTPVDTLSIVKAVDLALVCLEICRERGDRAGDECGEGDEDSELHFDQAKACESRLYVFWSGDCVNGCFASGLGGCLYVASH